MNNINIPTTTNNSQTVNLSYDNDASDFASAQKDAASHGKLNNNVTEYDIKFNDIDNEIDNEIVTEPDDDFLTQEEILDIIFKQQIINDTIRQSKINTEKMAEIMNEV